MGEMAATDFMDFDRLKINHSMLEDFWKVNAMHGGGQAMRNASKFPTSMTENFTQAFTTVATVFNMSKQSTLGDCDEYCDSNLRDLLNNYRKFHHGYVSLIICVFGTIANILNIIILTRKEMSKTPINSILKWLAVCDMFVMMEYIPFGWHMYLTAKGATDYSYTWAAYLLFHMHFSQILHTISISLTVTLACWRYIAIKHPHGSLGYIAQHHTGAAIALCFIISPLLCLPNHVVFYIKEFLPTKFVVNADTDSEFYKINFWVHAVIIKLLPCFILTIISFVLIDVLCRANKRKAKLKGYSQPGTNPNGNNRVSRLDRRTDRTTMLLVAVLILFLITEFPQGILGLLSGILGQCFLVRCYSMFGESMDLLALMNAAIGFVLYGSMSKQFRVTFKSLFLRQHPQSSKIEVTRVTAINHTTTNV